MSSLCYRIHCGALKKKTHWNNKRSETIKRGTVRAYKYQRPETIGRVSNLAFLWVSSFGPCTLSIALLCFRAELCTCKRTHLWTATDIHCLPLRWKSLLSTNPSGLPLWSFKSLKYTEWQTLSPTSYGNRRNGDCKLKGDWGKVPGKLIWSV